MEEVEWKRLKENVDLFTHTRMHNHVHIEHKLGSNKIIIIIIVYVYLDKWCDTIRMHWALRSSSRALVHCLSRMWRKREREMGRRRENKTQHVKPEPWALFIININAYEQITHNFLYQLVYTWFHTLCTCCRSLAGRWEECIVSIKFPIHFVSNIYARRQKR